ncbi:MAG: hypothetical protein LAT57_09230 [Balneolales bacterium]|nr:hypothetical protein [Balneolales bacterium]
MSKYITRLFLLLVVVMSASGSVLAQDMPSRGSYFVTNFTPKDYNAGTQNWEIVQDSNGLIYVANRDGVLVFDGATWEIIPLTLNTPLRSLAIDENDRVYVGAVGQFGYLKPDNIGKLQFVPLSDSIDSTIADVWEVHATTTGIYFVTRSEIFRYSDGQLSSIIPENQFARSFYVHNNLLVSIPGEGFFRIHANEKTSLIDNSSLENQVVVFAVPAPDDLYNEPGIYLGMNTSNVYFYGLESNKLISLNNSNENDFRFPRETYKTTRLNNGNYAFATISDGVFVADSRLNPLHRINRDGGLRVDMALNVFEDQHGSLWAALNNGISRIDEYDHIQYWNEDDGLSGTVLSLDAFNNQLYVSTSSGTFRFDESSSESPFTRLNSASAQKWQSITFTLNGREYLINAGNNVLTYLRGDNLELLASLGINSLFQSRLQPNRLYYGNLEGWGFFKISANGDVLTIDQRYHFSEPPFEIRSIAEDKRGDLWIGSRFSGIFKADSLQLWTPEYYESGNIQTQTFTYDWVDDIQMGSLVLRIDVLADTLAFSSTHGLINLSISDSTRFELSQTLEHPFAEEREFIRIVEGSQGEAFILYDERIVNASRSENGAFDVNYITGHLLPEGPLYDIIYHDGKIWVGGSEGLFVFSRMDREDQAVEFQTLVRSIYLQQDSLLFGGINASDFELNLPFDRNQLTINFAASRYFKHGSLKYESMLEGFDNNWSSPNEETRRIYTNLPDGNYTFRVRAIDIYGNVSSEGNIRIFVETPWFKTVWAYLLYVILLGLGAYGIVWLRTQSILRRNRELEILISKHTASLQIEKRRLENINEDLVAQDKNRDKFLSVVAHDLRNPLMIIRSSSELIDDDIESKEEIAELTGYISDAALRMQDIIESLLEDRAKKIRSSITDTNEVFLPMLVNKIVQENRPWAEKKNITLEVDIKNECSVIGDNAQVGVIFSNLVSNAVKYSPFGKTIWVSLKCENNEATFEVRDEGQGLSYSDLKDLGTPFKKLTAVPTDGEVSTGLGLHIVIDLLSDMDGRLIVHSDGLGMGASFKAILTRIKD